MIPWFLSNLLELEIEKNCILINIWRLGRTTNNKVGMGILKYFIQRVLRA